jgi:hypothetical protein
MAGGSETNDSDGLGFYAGLPVFDRFSRLTDPAIYQPLPDDWVLGLSDIVRSTVAITAGRYKEINTAAASVIAAVANELGRNDFPFVFGGDGASFALPRSQAALARGALSAVAGWARDSFGFEMRIGLIPVSEVRAHGHDVRVARFGASPDVTYAMFAGGGMAYAERRMKEGALAIPAAERGILPDLTGLSCRFDEIRAERGMILSLIVVLGSQADTSRFNDLVDRILSLAENRAEAGRPIPEEGPGLSGPFTGFGTEAKAMKGTYGSGLLAAARLAMQRLVSFAVLRQGRAIGGFDPVRYRHQLVENTDFRKFDDGLRMTLDCTPALADRLERLLAEAQEAGIVRYGLHRQDSALMTCFVPSPTRSDHIHFVDGATGGYTMAARALKS